MLNLTAETRTPKEIAREILADYRRQGKPVYYAAKPYVEAMWHLDSWEDSYFYDSAEDVANYALSNLSYWRGDTAKRIRAELKDILRGKR